MKWMPLLSMCTLSVGHALYTDSEVLTLVYPTKRTSMLHFHGKASVPCPDIALKKSNGLVLL